MIHQSKFRSPYLLSLLLFVLAPLISARFQTDMPLLDSVELSSAIALHLLLSACLLAGYALFSRPIVRRPRSAGVCYEISQGDWYFGLSYFFLVVGVAASVYSATYDQGLGDYVLQLANGAVNLRQAFMKSSADGGVSGLIKIQAYLPLAVLISAAVQVQFADQAGRQKRALRLMRAATVAVLIKTVFAQDRMTLVALGVIYGAQFLQKVDIRRLTWVIVAGGVASFVSSLRLADYGIGKFLALYAKLGIVNLQNDIANVSDLGFGVQTFLHPLIFFSRFFGHDIDTDVLIESWTWSPAQNLYGYLFIDYGLWSVLVAFLLGALIARIEFLGRTPSLRWRAVYFNVLYCVVSFIGVPAFRGLEFWYGIAIEVLLLRAVQVSRQVPNGAEAVKSAPITPNELLGVRA